MAGSVSGACDSCSQSSEFELHVGCRDYIHTYTFKKSFKIILSEEALPVRVKDKENTKKEREGRKGRKKMPSEPLYQFPIATVTNYGKLSDLEQLKFIILHFWSSEV